MAQAALGLPQDARIILSVGNLTKDNPWKDYATMEGAVRLAGLDNDERLIFLALGQEAPDPIAD